MSDYFTDALPDAVQWAEGMLLTPQHFQQHDIYWQAALAQRLRGLSAHAWGLRELQLDLPALAGGSVVVQALACIFRDGTPYVMREQDARSSMLRLVVGPQEALHGAPLRICIAIAPRTGAMKVPSTSIKRYDNAPGDYPVIDELTGIADVYVDRLRLKVELYREQDVPAGYLALPLIELARDPKSAQLLPTRYQPPMLRMGALATLDGGLTHSLRALRDQLWDKLHKLTGMAQDDSPERISTLSPEERLQLAQARHLGSVLPLFDALLLDPEVAPVQAYHALLQAVGGLAWVGSNPAPPVMPPYAHENCAPQFAVAMDYLRRKLALIDTNWESLAFSRVSDSIFARRMPAPLPAPLYLELRLREGQSLRDAQSWLADARIGSEELMPLLRQRRLPGAERRLLGSTELARLGLRSDAIVLQVDNQRVEVPQQGVVDCLHPGRSLLIHSDSVQHAPAAVLLQLRRGAAQPAAAASPAKEAADV